MRWALCAFGMAGPAPPPNPQVYQIVQILNAHLSSLQWIDQNAAALNLRLQELSKKSQAVRSDSERLNRNG